MPYNREPGYPGPRFSTDSGVHPVNVFVQDNGGFDVDGSGYFHIFAQVLSVGEGGEPEPVLPLLPGDGRFLPMQRFDLGILLKPGYKAEEVWGSVRDSVTVSVNGYRRDDNVYNCHINGGSYTTGYFLICPDAHDLLEPTVPESRVTVDVKMTDRTIQSDSVTWELLQP